MRDGGALPVAVTHGGDIFAIARTHGWDWRTVIDFSASINPLGPAPGVAPAICRAVERIRHYPEREPVELRRRLAALWSVEKDQILLGNGATELIFFLARLHASTHVTLALPVFSEFHRAFPQAALASLHSPESWPSGGLMVVTRPANPTGWSVDLEMLTNRPLLIDESFLEYSGLPSAATLMWRNPQWMVLRSLTKFYALPGLRIGALIASADAVRNWRKWREPWQVNVLAEAAALAALEDRQHAEKSLRFVENERAWLREKIAELPGCDPLPSDANFLYTKLSYSSEILQAHLLKEKLLVRNCTGWPGLSDEAVRVAVRTREENMRLLQAWSAFK